MAALCRSLTILTELFAKLHDKNFRVAAPDFMTGREDFECGAQGAQCAPLEEKRFRESRRAARLLRKRKVLPPSSASDSADVRIKRHLGRLCREEGAQRPSFRSKAFAKFSTRLVPNQDPHKIAKLVEKHIRKLLPKTVHCKFEVLSMGKPWVAPYHDPIFKKAQNALEKGSRQEGRFYSRGRFHPFRNANARHLQSAVRLIGLRPPDENAHAPMNTLPRKLLRRHQGHCPLSTRTWPTTVVPDGSGKQRTGAQHDAVPWYVFFFLFLLTVCCHPAERQRARHLVCYALYRRSS